MTYPINSCPDITTDQVVLQEIENIQKQLNNAIDNHLHMIKIDNTYMTDINYNNKPGSDIEAKLDQEIADRKAADSAILEQLNQEIANRQQADADTLANAKILIEAEATERKNADTDLQNQINNITSLTDEEIQKKVNEAIEPLQLKIEELSESIEKSSSDCMDAWKREQARAMSVEENLQEQIYLIGEDGYVRKDEPIQYDTILLPENIEVEEYNEGFLRKDEPIGFVEALEDEETGN